MKKLFFAFAFLLCAFSASAQVISKEEEEIMEIIKKQDSIPRSVFLDSTSFDNQKLKSVSNWRHFWGAVSNNKMSLSNFQDVRLKFSSREEALAFHKKYRKLNSEYGKEIKTKIKVDGAEELNIYTGTGNSEALMNSMGHKSFCVCFVCENYFVKFYVACGKHVKPSELTQYITKAVEKIKSKK